MRTNRLVGCNATLALLCLIAGQLSPISAAAQRPKSSPPRKAAAASTTTPAAASNAVRAAFRTSLAQPAVRAAAKTEIQRQIRVNFPLAFISGTWVSPIDMGLVYRNPAVRAAVIASLGQSGPTLVNAAIGDPARVVLAFTPQQLGQLLMRDLMKEIGASMNPGALAGNVTDNYFIGMLVMVSFAILGTVTVMEVLHHHDPTGGATPAPTAPAPPYDPNADQNGNGIPNSQDPDDDGDGYPDDTNGVPDDGEDDYPNDPNRHICMCGGNGGIYFGTRITAQVAKALNASVSAAKAQFGSAISLGAVQAGQTAAIRVAVP